MVTTKEVIDTLTEKQKKDLYSLVGTILETGKYPFDNYLKLIGSLSTTEQILIVKAIINDACTDIRRNSHMNENEIIGMLGDIRYEMFDILDGDELVKVLQVIDAKMKLYNGKSNEDIAKELMG